LINTSIRVNRTWNISDIPFEVKKMIEPIDAVMAIHNAFRVDMGRIDDAALSSAQGKTGFEAAIGRFRFFNEVLVWHAHGEELAIFPQLEAVAPSVAEAYERDHRGLDAAYDALNDAVSAQNPLATARATAAFKFHLDLHLGKEDAHLYRLFKERVPLPQRNKAVGIMASKVPQNRSPEFMEWLFPLLGSTDRKNMVQVMQALMPPPVFAQAKPLMQKAIGKDWADLIRQIPALA
jgi:hypothetical protein